MKKIIALLLACMLILTGCAPSNSSGSTIKETSDPSTESTSDISSKEEAIDEPLLEQEDVSFKELNDPELLQYIRDTVYADLEYRFHSDDYIIDDIQAIYISKEYIEELDYNSKENIFFGYTLSELRERFQGEKYVFTLDDNNETTVQAFENFDQTFGKVLKNVAIGSGVILVCVTVSVVSGGVGAPATSLVFAASAKSATIAALSSGTFSAVTAGVVDGYQNKDFDSAIKAAALKGSEGFKWGAISGAVLGGIRKAHQLSKIRTPRGSEEWAAKIYGGEEQKCYLGGKKVSYGTQNSTRPDLVRMKNGRLEAIEVKNYDLRNKSSVNNLYRELERQVKERMTNLPEGSTQRVVLDIHGRKYPKELVNEVVTNIQQRCSEFYPDLPIDLLT